jgi:fructose-1,6-bisphosphatase/inositol monophosphatase family enzyme
MRWHELARRPALLEVERAVDEGSRLLREGRGKMDTVIAKGDRDFATALDVEAERLIRSSLQRLAPDIAFLGEEHGGPTPASQPIWVLDPIDGTVNFARGSPLCAISLALVELGLPRMAIVDFPFLGERYLAAEGAGAYLNGAPIRTVERSLANSVVGFTDFSVGHDAPSENAIHLRLMAALAATALRVRVHGSEALDLAWLASGSTPRLCCRTSRGTSAAARCSSARRVAPSSTSTDPSTGSHRPPRSPPRARSSDPCSESSRARSDTTGFPRRAPAVAPDEMARLRWDAASTEQEEAWSSPAFASTSPTTPT